MTRWKATIRSLARRPAFAAAAIAVLGFGIGANSIVFSIVDTVLLKPLPYRDPQQIVSLLDGNPAKNERESLISPARLADWMRLSTTFEAISGVYTENVTDTGLSDPERLAGRRVAPGYFSVFSMRPLLGRTFVASEEKFGGPQAAVLSEGLWTRRYHRDPRVIGAHLLLTGAAYTIVGVMPKEFAMPTIDVWMPAQIPPGVMHIRQARFFAGVGRMRRGVNIRQARADLSRVCRRLGEIYPDTDKGWSALLTDYKQHWVGGNGRPLEFVFAAAVLLLLILCANIAGLQLAQLQRRERELAIRGSLGASRGQIAAVLLREIAIIGCLSGVIGLALAGAGARVMAHLFSDLPRMQELRFDWRLALFTIGLSAAAALICGALPVFKATRRDLHSVLAQGGRTQTTGGHLWQRATVGAQFAVTLVLLAGAGLLLRSYYNLTRVQPGFEASHVITFHVGAEWGEDRGKIGLLQQQLIERFEQLPGVRAAGLSNFLPASGATLREQVSVDGFPQAGNNGQITTGTRSVTEGYLRALQVPLLQGSFCPAFRVDQNAPPQVLVNKRFAELLGASDLIGHRLTWTGYRGVSGAATAQIIGVAGDVKEDALNAPVVPYVYTCIRPGNWPDPEYVVAGQGSTRDLIAAVRQVIHQAAPHRAFFGVTTVAEYLEQTLDRPRLNAGLVSVFAISALLSAALGLYGLVMLAVIGRTKEIGLRMALGAAPARVVREVLLEAVRPLVPALLVGLAIAFAVLRTFQSVLFEVRASDALTFLSVCVLLLAVAFAAALIPSRRAASVDPAEALRSE
jgi:putative ABC transport system permease protein